jgi:surface antigen
MSVDKRWLTESMLVAYVDGELDADQAAKVAEALRDDPEARATVALLRCSAAAVREAFAVPPDRPVPERLLALLGAEPKATGSGAPERLQDEHAGGEIVPLPALRRPAATGWRRFALPVAASIAALLIGFAGGSLYRAGGAADGNGNLELAGASTADPAEGRFEEALYRALESGEDGERFAYDHAASGVHGTITLLDPVATRAGLPCREFRREETRNGAVDIAGGGLACRGADGGWTVFLSGNEDGS